MTLLKLVAMLGVLICSTLGIVLVLDLVSDAEALEALKKSLLVIGILTMAAGALFLISGQGKVKKD
jgi:hypothetical protein